jgi:predicted metal-dependent hydrolase
MVIAHLAEDAINYRLVRSRRRTLAVEIRDGLVTVRSPLLLPQRYIDRFLIEKAGWIAQRINESKKRAETGILFLGKRYEVSYSDRYFVNDEINIRMLGTSNLERKKSLEKFYRDETANRVEGYLVRYSNAFNYGAISYKKYSSRWGSCSPKNDLQFNIFLSMCPETVIEYVVVHELCHTKIKNHSRRFYNLIAEHFPEYKKAIKWLRENRGLI